MGQRQLVEVEAQDVAGAEYGHHYTEATKDQEGEWVAIHPQPHQAQKRSKIYS